MLTGLIGWSLRNGYLVLAAALGVAVAGGLALCALNIDAFPDTTPVQVQVNTVSPSLVPEEVERQIMHGLAKLEQDAERMASLTGFAWIRRIPLAIS